MSFFQMFFTQNMTKYKLVRLEKHCFSIYAAIESVWNQLIIKRLVGNWFQNTPDTFSNCIFFHIFRNFRLFRGPFMVQIWYFGRRKQQNRLKPTLICYCPSKSKSAEAKWLIWNWLLTFEETSNCERIVHIWQRNIDNFKSY